jgi:beta-aspartyl-dipeptidase (metallo-type)
MMMVEEVIGTGEIAIADRRSSQPTVVELAKIVNATWNGGLMSGKAGVVHFHVGDGAARLAPLREMLASHDIKPESLYPTHLERNAKLMEEGVELAKAGVTIDMDVEDRDLAKWLSFYLERGGPKDRFTASSDAAIMAPATLFEQVRSCVVEHRMPLETVLPTVTTNTARVLRLARKGRIVPGADADWITVDRKDFQVRDVAAKGRLMVRDRKLLNPPVAVSRGNRRHLLYG